MSRIRFGVWAAMALILAPLAGAQSYTITDLGLLPGTTSCDASGVNDRGDVAGVCLASDNVPSAFLWTASGGMENLGTLAGADYNYAYGLNNSDLVVGYSVFDGGVVKAFLWRWPLASRDEIQPIGRGAMIA